MIYFHPYIVQIHQNHIDVNFKWSNGSTWKRKYFYMKLLWRVKSSFSRANHELVGVDRACEAQPNDATVIRFKLLIECVEGVCSRLDLECWANIHDEINLDRTNERGWHRLKSPVAFTWTVRRVGFSPLHWLRVLRSIRSAIDYYAFLGDTWLSLIE